MSTRSEQPLRARSLILRALLPTLSLLLLALVLAPVSEAADDAPDQGEAGPLRVTLTGLSPAVVPRSGTLTLTGSLTNTSDEEWRDVNVHSWASTTPMTTSAQVEAGADTPYDAEVGRRLTAPRAFVAVGDLEPGQSTTFTIRLPRSLLPIPDQPGVYWVGLHALGTSEDGRDNVADGRARTFIPVVAPSARKRPLPTSFVLPLRQEVRRDDRGRLRDPDDWATLLRSTGRLGRLLGLAESSTTLPVTLLLDPAVLDATGALARGSDDGATTSLARSWLQRTVALASDGAPLTLGYADPDTASLAAREPALLGEARRLAQQSLAAQGVTDSRPAVAPTDGVLPGSALSEVPDDTQVLLSAKAAKDAPSSLASTSAGQPLALADTDATARGPGPGATDTALSYRQRILAEGALRVADGDRDPMIVSPPADWDPGEGWQTSSFFSGLDVPWLSWSRLGSRSAAGRPAVSSVTYSKSARRAQVGNRLVNATRSATRSGDTFAAALEEPGDTADAYARLALQGTSYAARGAREQSYRDVRALDASIRSRLSRISVRGSDFVTLSGGSGRFVVSLVNDLDRPVRVGLSATTSKDDLSLELPRSVVLPARQRTTVRIEARSTQTGVRAVTISPTTPDGTAIGTPLSFNVRDSQVSSLIWVVLGGGVLLLVAMILRRFARRGLRRERDESAT